MSMRRIIIFITCFSCASLASEFSEWFKLSQQVSDGLEKILMDAVDGVENDPKDIPYHVAIITGMQMGVYGDVDELLVRNKVPPLSQYISRTDIRQSSLMCYRLGCFAYTQGLTHIAKSLFEASIDEDRSYLDFSLGIVAAYDEENIPKALEYFDRGNSLLKNTSYYLLKYMFSPQSQKYEFAQEIKRTTKNRGYYFDIDWFTVNILDQAKSFKEIESLLWAKTRLGDNKAQMHLYQLYALNTITFKKPRVRDALLFDLALNKKMPEAQFVLGRRLVVRNWQPSPRSLSFQLDGYALMIQSYKEAKEEWYDFPLEKMTPQELDALKHRKVKYNPYWNIDPII